MKMFGSFLGLQYFVGSLTAFIRNSSYRFYVLVSMCSFLLILFHAWRHWRGKLELLRIRSCPWLCDYGTIAITRDCVLVVATLVDFWKWLRMAEVCPPLIVKNARQIRALLFTRVTGDRWAGCVRFFFEYAWFGYAMFFVMKLKRNMYVVCMRNRITIFN